MSFCQVAIVGNIVKEPEFRATQDGKVEVKLSVAINWGRNDNKKSAFFDVSNIMTQETYEKTYYMYAGSKGKQVTVMGELRPNRTQDGKTFLNVSYARIELARPENGQPTQEAQPQQPQSEGYEPEPQPQYQPTVQPQTQAPVQVQQPAVPPVPAGFPAKPVTQQRTGNPLPPPPLVGR